VTPTVSDVTVCYDNTCSGAANGTACNDGNACTQTDTCQTVCQTPWSARRSSARRGDVTEYGVRRGPIRRTVPSAATRGPRARTRTRALPVFATTTDSSRARRAARARRMAARATAPITARGRAARAWTSSWHRQRRAVRRRVSAT
jgi:hypothetical protein